MYVCMHTCMYVCMYVCVYIYVCIYIYIYIYVCVCVYYGSNSTRMHVGPANLVLEPSFMLGRGSVDFLSRIEHDRIGSTINSMLARKAFRMVSHKFAVGVVLRTGIFRSLAESLKSEMGKTL